MASSDPIGDLATSTGLDAALRDLVRSGAVEVPPYPAIALRVAAVAAQGDYGLDELVRAVSADEGLALDLLRTANSALWARGEPVTSVAAAIQRVGGEEVRRVALASGLGRLALSAGPLAPLRRRAWHAALSSAALCRELARVRGLSPDEAFSCGLLHDFGAVVALDALERLAGGARAGGRFPAAFWQAVVDRYHVELGGVLARRWGLPRALAEAIAHHHGDAPADASAPGLLAVLRTSDAIVRVLDDRAGLAPADVRSVAALSEAECDAIERALSGLASFVASFERPARPDDLALVAPMTELTRPDHTLERRPGVELRIAERTFEVVGFAPNQLVVRGPMPLPEETLLEVTSGALPPFHARVLACWAEGDRFGAMLAPFALSGRGLLQWRGIAPPRGNA